VRSKENPQTEDDAHHTKRVEATELEDHLLEKKDSP